MMVSMQVVWIRTEVVTVEFVRVESWMMQETRTQSVRVVWMSVVLVMVMRVVGCWSGCGWSWGGEGVGEGAVFLEAGDVPDWGWGGGEAGEGVEHDERGGRRRGRGAWR